MDINEISKYRIKLCLFFIATVFYGALVTIDLLFGGMITPKPIKDILINAFIWLIFFVPYLFLLYMVIKDGSNIKNLFYIDKEHKTKDIIQITIISLLFFPFVFFSITIIYWLISWFSYLLSRL